MPKGTIAIGAIITIGITLALAIVGAFSSVMKTEAQDNTAAVGRISSLEASVGAIHDDVSSLKADTKDQNKKLDLIIQKLK